MPKKGSRRGIIWWNRGESNPCPETGFSLGIYMLSSDVKILVESKPIAHQLTLPKLKISKMVVEQLPLQSYLIFYEAIPTLSSQELMV